MVSGKFRYYSYYCPDLVELDYARILEENGQLLLEHLIVLPAPQISKANEPKNFAETSPRNSSNQRGSTSQGRHQGMNIIGA